VGEGQKTLRKIEQLIRMNQFFIFRSKIFWYHSPLVDQPKQPSLTCPSDVIYEIIMETVIPVIVRRMGEETLDLSLEDMELIIVE